MKPGIETHEARAAIMAPTAKVYKMQIQLRLEFD